MDYLLAMQVIAAEIVRRAKAESEEQMINYADCIVEFTSESIDDLNTAVEDKIKVDLLK